MDCNGYRENITNYIDNELTTQENKLMLEHEDDCTDCVQVKSEIQKLLGTFKIFKKVKASDSFESSLYEKLNSMPQNSFLDKIEELFEPSPIGLRSLAAGFAVIMMLVSGSYFMYNGSFLGEDEGLPPLSSPRYIEKSEDINNDVIEEETADLNKEDEEADEDEKVDAENSSKNELISE